MSYPGDVNLKLTNVPTSPCYAILMMPMIIPCSVICLTCFVSVQVNQLQHAVPVQQRYKTTADHGKYHTHFFFFLCHQMNLKIVLRVAGNGASVTLEVSL